MRRRLKSAGLWLFVLVLAAGSMALPWMVCQGYDRELFAQPQPRPATDLDLSAAARELGVSQPSVSQAVREMEEHYGVRLFDRISKKLFLTDQGQRVLQPVVNLAQKARPQLCGKHVPREHYFVAALNAICHLINLYLGNRSPDTDHFAFKRGVSNFYVANLIH